MLYALVLLSSTESICMLALTNRVLSLEPYLRLEIRKITCNDVPLGGMIQTP